MKTKTIKITKKMQEEINKARKMCGFCEKPIKKDIVGVILLK